MKTLKMEWSVAIDARPRTVLSAPRGIVIRQILVPTAALPRDQQ